MDLGLKLAAAGDVRSAVFSWEAVMVPQRLNGERRSFALLRPVVDTTAQTAVRERILDASGDGRCPRRERTQTKPFWIPGNGAFVFSHRLATRSIPGRNGSRRLSGGSSR